MIIGSINETLQQVVDQPSRDNILELAFQLLEWMGLESNKNKNPQLVAPKTQKLREYLATAPNTTQPQLYRLNTENAPIRVRFAVLKKIKKDYIAQLVDNDPGAESYQNTPDALKRITKAPYFLHLVTTPEYDRLVLIFNHADQKRIVVFRNRLTQTQYNKIILQWHSVASKSKPEISDLLWRSLDIKEVNKEFYIKIKEHFDALIGIVKTQYIDATEQQTKQFTVRLIGRYIFCWFLKEKGIIAHSLIGAEAIAQTPNYYQQTLLKLFFETLNTQVQDRNPQTHEKQFAKIPYLNGGLFDENEEDKLFKSLKLDHWLLSFVRVLESYDFTVDESTSQYQQVAVDPEMLGRIFENLLASQNEETEKLANQRKAFGAFYTPREIVDYMVKESIKNYLAIEWEQIICEKTTANLNNPGAVSDIFGNVKPQQLKLPTKQYTLNQEEKGKLIKHIEPVFNNIPDSGHLKKEEKLLLLRLLEGLKIIDPACGSGAFPMGVLNKLVIIHETLGTTKSGYELKKDLLSQNIYGVDIMPMAVEIARLRAWLSLILEEEYKPNEPKHNFGIRPLPNLDFKFVCANSLLDLGLDDLLKGDTIGLYRHYYQMLKDLEQLRKEFFLPTYANNEKEGLKHQYLSERDKVVAAIESDSNLRLKLIAKRIKHWNPFDDSIPSPFFSPTWMFGVEKGFDIVIGNPPYIQMQKDNGRLAILLKDAGYTTFERTGDIYALFYELGFKLLKNKGIHTFITSSQWMKASYGKSLRKLFISKNPLRLISLGPGVFESAVVDTNILIARNEENKNQLLGAIVDQPEQLNNLESLPYVPMPNATVEKWSILSDGKFTLNEKIKAKGKALNKWKLKIYRGITTGYNEAFIVDESTRVELVNEDPKCQEIIKPILRGREIESYYTKWDGDYVVATFPTLHIDIDKYLSVKKYLSKFLPKLNQTGDTFINREGKKEKTRKLTAHKWFEAQDQINYYKEFFKEKIIWKRIGSHLRFSYSDEGIYSLDSTCIATGEKIKYLTALLNSKLCIYNLTETAPKTGMGDLIISVQALEPFLVYYPTDSEQKKVEEIFDLIINKKKAGQDTTALENKIDLLVYKFYDLTIDEVKTIDPDFGLTEEEYERV